MDSKRPVVPEGLGPESRQLAVYGEVRRARSTRARLVMGVLWSSLGSTFVVLAPVLANVLIAFGFALAMGEGGRRGRVIALLASLGVGCASTGLLYGAGSLPMTLISVVGAFALARGYVLGKLTTAGLLAVAATVSLAMIGIDTVSTSLQGTSIGQVITSVVDQALEASWGSLDLDGTAAVLEAKESVISYWPTMYFALGLGVALCSVLGARLGFRTEGARARAGMIVSYDVPLLVGCLFAGGVAVQLLGPRLPSLQAEVATAGANVVACCRIVLAQQGVSVLLWWMRERRAGLPARTMSVLAALWLELSFACASVLGLVDMAVNFRHLERRRPDLSLGSARER